MNVEDIRSGRNWVCTMSDCPCHAEEVSPPEPTRHRVYVSGPMSGKLNSNFFAFFEAEEFLREKGWDVVNPARIDRDEGFDPGASHESYMRRDIPEIVACDAIAVLPEWWTSRGAKDEMAVAKMCGLDVISATDGLPITDPFEEREPAAESPLTEALRIVHGRRGDDYGPPDLDFERTGRMWGALLGLGYDVRPSQVALCMIALKLSRESWIHGRDNLVDAAGYVETLAMIEGETE